MKLYRFKKSEDELVVEIYMPEAPVIPSSCLDYEPGHAGNWAMVYPITSKARAILNAAQGVASYTRCDYDQSKRRKSKFFFHFEFKDENDKVSFLNMIEDYMK